MNDSQEMFTPSIEDKIEVRRRLRKQIEEAKPRAAQVLKKSGIKPVGRTLINVSGELVRKDYEAETDKLTGIPNRDSFFRRGKEELERAKRLGYKISIVILDLNNIKQINDTLGYDAGDQKIKDAATCIREGTRETDVIARLGGDEFGAVLAEADYEGSQRWWERVNELLEKKAISIGAGVIEVDPSGLDKDTDWDAKFKEYRSLADKPLHLAKTQMKFGGDRNTMTTHRELSERIGHV